MKKKILNIILAVLLIVGMLIGLTACGDNDEKNKAKIEVSYIGKSSAQELIKNFYEDEVRWSNINKAKKYFNIEAMVACEILQDMELDFDELYEMMFNLDKGTKYIKDNYKDFVKAVEEEDMEFDSDIIKRLKEMKEEKEEEIEIIIDNLVGYPDSYVDTVEKTDNYTDIKAKNFNVYDLIIKYNDSESTDTYLDVWTIKIDGKYYIVGID